MSKKLLFVPIALAIVLAVVVAGAALAQTATPVPNGSNQGTTPNAQTAPGLGRFFGRAFGFGFGLGSGKQDWSSFDAAAKALNLTPAELFDQLHSGKTLSEVAQAQGVDISAVQSAVEANRTQALKDRINQEVQNGTITKEQGDWLLQGLNNGWLGGHGLSGRGLGGKFGGMGRFGRGMGRGNNAAPTTPQNQATPGA